MNKEEAKSELVEVLRDISKSLAGIESSVSSIKNDGLILNSQATQAFTSAIESGGFGDILSAFSNGASSTSDVTEVLDSLRSGSAMESGGESAQSLVESLKEAKERLSEISLAIGNAKPNANLNSDI